MRRTLEGGDKGVKNVRPLLVHGRGTGADDAVSLRSWQRAKAARDFLLDLGHSDGLFGKIIGERHIGLCHKAPNIVAVTPQSANQMGGLALLGLAPPGGRSTRASGGRCTGRVSTAMLCRASSRHATQDTFELLEQGQRIERLASSFGVTTHPGQRVGGKKIQPVQLLGNR